MPLVIEIGKIRLCCIGGGGVEVVEEGLGDGGAVEEVEMEG